MSEYKNLEVKNLSKKEIIIRIVAVVALLAIAVTSIVLGVNAYINSQKKAVGSYTLNLESSSEDGPYNMNLGISYYCDDSNGSDANTKFNNVSSFAMNKASEIYSYLDNTKAYKNEAGEYLKNNLHAINDSLGQKLQITKTLYEILSDAYNKTNEVDSHYSIYSGMLNYFWWTLLSNDLSVDPYYNKDSKEIISILSELSKSEYYTLNLEQEVKDGTNYYYVTFDMTSEGKLKFEANQDRFKFIKDNLGVYPILDLNVLLDSYYIQYLADAFIQASWTKGIIYSYTGIYVNLGEYGETEAVANIPVFDYDNLLQANLIGMYSSKQPLVATSIKSFPYFTYEKNYAYKVFKDAQGNIVSHSVYFDYKTGYSSKKMHNSILVNTGRNVRLYDLTYKNLNLVLNEATNLEDYKTLPFGAGVIFDSENKTLNINSEFSSKFNKTTQLNYTIKTF